MPAITVRAWVLDAGGAEIDSVFIPVINCTWGFGETGMEIWAIRPAADGGYYISGRQYVEDCDQRFTVIKSEADGSFGPVSSTVCGPAMPTTTALLMQMTCSKLVSIMVQKVLPETMMPSTGVPSWPVPGWKKIPLLVCTQRPEIH